MKSKIQLSALQLLIISFLSSTTWSACSIRPITHAELSDSSVDIIYTLGHNQHRFTAESHSGKFVARTFLDKKLLDENAVDSLNYYDFVHKASNFMGDRRRVASVNNAESLASCRAPYTVVIRLSGDAKTYQGCRSIDDGNLSRLVRDGEFLLYSKK